MAIDTYPGSNENAIYITSTGNVFVTRWVALGSHTTSGYYHDSLNLLISVKFI